MGRVILALIFILVQTTSIVASEGEYRALLVGKFIHLGMNDQRNVYGAPYYFLLTKDGRNYVYPVEMPKEVKGRKVKEIRDKIEKSIKETFILEAKIRTEQVRIEDRQTELLILELIEAKPMRLEWLGIPYPFSTYLEPLTVTEEIGKGPPEGRLILPDRVAEGLIFVAGASLLAAFLAKSGAYVEMEFMIMP